MSRFYKKFWHRTSNRSVFGGRVATQEEIERLSERIKAQEAKELADFEASMDKALEEATKEKEHPTPKKAAKNSQNKAFFPHIFFK